MNLLKWIGGAIGWSFGGPIGAIIGLALGSLIEKSSKKEDFHFNEKTKNKRYNPSKNEFQNKQQQQKLYTKPGDFDVSLLILSSIIIKSDGIQDQRELNYVRKQFVAMYGKERANRSFELFKQINKQRVSTRQVCLQIKHMMDHASRLQLLHFLFGIAKADGSVSSNELKQIYIISGYLGINTKDVESIKSMFYNDINSAYKVLEISSNVSDEEIKRAYRKMAKKFHPDLLTHLGEAHRKGAELKFKEVQEAYERIRKERKFI